ncbi:LysR family transcriptional regulator [Variovorax sp. PAMC26660]|uniref:LysR family transcriptional regulator n=1 Tax=Variovorax sp. PAMC26660 TaxID=2762322 RepID=UPI00164D3881|nr:LysR family transcriptional regulator [Variovorax sp. PAMC26660]QNK67685.1 LysR family transcriptional regulator [Variovorax sp. PAMC26660]
MALPLLSIPMRHFLEVARSGSVNQAAARLFVASSAVSRQIAKLEDSLGTPLFERHARGMALTAAGERLAAHLRNAQLDIEQVFEQVRDLGGQGARRIRMACTEGFAGHFMPLVMRSFEETHPGCQLELHVGSPDGVSALLARGETDIALKYVVAPEPGLAVAHTATAPVYAVLRPNHPLARQRVVSVADAVRYPLAVGDKGVTARQLFDQACSLQGLQYRAIFVSNFSSVLLPLLRSSDVMLSGHLTVMHLIDAGTVVARPFAEAPLQQRQLQVLALEGRTLPPLAQDFVQHLVETIAKAGRRKLGLARACA